MYQLFAHTSGWLVLVIFMLAPAVVAMALHAGFRRIVPASDLLPHQAVAGYLVAIVGVLYAVVLGFEVISVWSSFDQTQRNADAETTQITEILYVARSLPKEIRRRERALLGAYSHEVRDTEWEMLAKGKEDARARALLVQALQAIASMQIPPGTGQSEVLRLTSLRETLLASFRDLETNRRLRVLAQSHVQPTMYFALIVGGMLLMTFVFLFGVANLPLQLIMTGLVAAMIGLLIGVVFEMDRPFWGAVHVNSDAWTLLIQDNHL